jgi:hypothetical protein
MSVCGFVEVVMNLILCLMGLCLLLSHLGCREGSCPCLVRGGRWESRATMESLGGGMLMLSWFQAVIRACVCGSWMPVRGSHVGCHVHLRRGWGGVLPRVLWLRQAGHVKQGLSGQSKPRQCLW